MSLCFVFKFKTKQKDFFVLLKMKKCYGFLAKTNNLYEICPLKR